MNKGSEGGKERSAVFCHVRTRRRCNPLAMALSVLTFLYAARGHQTTDGSIGRFQRWNNPSFACSGDNLKPTVEGMEGQIRTGHEMPIGLLNYVHAGLWKCAFFSVSSGRIEYNNPSRGHFLFLILSPALEVPRYGTIFFLTHKSLPLYSIPTRNKLPIDDRC